MIDSWQSFFFGALVATLALMAMASVYQDGKEDVCEYNGWKGLGCQCLALVSKEEQSHGE